MHGGDTQLSRTAGKELEEATAGFARGRPTPPGTQPWRSVGRGRWVGRVATRDVPVPNAEGAGFWPPEPRGSGAYGSGAVERGLGGS